MRASPKEMAALLVALAAGGRAGAALARTSAGRTSQSLVNTRMHQEHDGPMDLLITMHDVLGNSIAVAKGLVRAAAGSFVEGVNLDRSGNPLRVEVEVQRALQTAGQYATRLVGLKSATFSSGRLADASSSHAVVRFGFAMPPPVLRITPLLLLSFPAPRMPPGGLEEPLGSDRDP